MKILEDKGYKCWKTDQNEYSTTKHYQRRADKDAWFDAPLCRCNEKLCINIDEHQFSVGEISGHSFTVSICAEGEDGDWCDIKIYGIKPDEIEKKIDSFEDKVLNMWKAFNE